MANRPMNYRLKSLEELLKGYAHEVGRENKEDAEITQKHIVNEVYARIRDAFNLLDTCPSEVDKIYSNLLEH